jgi:hypothetical protein
MYVSLFSEGGGEPHSHGGRTQLVLASAKEAGATPILGELLLPEKRVNDE